MTHLKAWLASCVIARWITKDSCRSWLISNWNESIPPHAKLCFFVQCKSHIRWFGLHLIRSQLMPKLDKINTSWVKPATATASAVARSVEQSVFRRSLLLFQTPAVWCRSVLKQHTESYIASDVRVQVCEWLPLLQSWHCHQCKTECENG